MPLRFWRHLVAGAACLLPGACAERQAGLPDLSLTPVAYGDIDGWTGDDLRGLLGPLLAECTMLARLPADTGLGGEGLALRQAGRAGLYGPACRAVARLPANDPVALRRTIETWFLPYAIDGSAKVTGYFEPTVDGSLTREPGFTVPVYGRPTELLTVRPGGGSPVTGVARDGLVVPAWSRAEIDRGALAGRGLEIVWLRSTVDLFFLQVQGAGRVRLPDGRIVRLGYAGRNGQPYVPIGRVLVDRLELEPGQVSMQSIRAWLEAHPGRAADMMERNPNYVFFRVLDQVATGEGPPGALGLPLTPLRSVAVDRKFVPLGVPMFVATTVKDGLRERGALDRLMLAQDIGSDITGPTRADVFFGWDDAAGAMAGGLAAEGRLFVLLPRQPGPPAAAR